MRIIIVLLSILLSQTGFAATTTQSHILGFSTDGRYFVFEEFAVGDGAGIPKATLYVIDTRDDSWVSGTPISTKRTEADVIEAEGRDYAEIERQEIASVRKEVREKAASILSRIGPLVPGKKRIHNTVFDFGSNAQLSRFTTLDYQQTINTPVSQMMWRVEVETISFTRNKSCFYPTDKMEGFRLRLTDERDDTSHVISEDKRVPKSRGCASNYKIEQVVSYNIDGSNIVLAILIRYARPGFEGADGRLLAITTRVKN